VNHRYVLIRRCLGVLVLWLGLSAAFAEDASVASSDNPIRDRTNLLDGPGTPRQALRDAGVDIEFSWTQFGQGVVSGEDEGWKWSGSGDLGITFDGEKLGLWPGFSVLLRQEITTGDDFLAVNDGAFIPVNTAVEFPRSGGSDYETSVTLTQTFGNTYALTLGKFDTVHNMKRIPLQGGGGLDTFMNIGTTGGVTAVTPPYALGGLLAIKTQPVSFVLFVYDPRNAQRSDVISEPFSEGVTASVTALLPTEIAGLRGYYSVRGVLSNAEGIDLRDIPAIPVPPEYQEQIGTVEDPWYVSFNAQQYLWHNPEDPRKGWGVWFSTSRADGNPSYLEWAVWTGIGGDSPIAGRSDDRWGIGYFQYNLSEDLLTSLEEGPLELKFGSEEGVEAYYNFAVTPWLRLTADLQWIDDPITTNDETWLAAARMQIKF
jgi:porin